MLLNGISNRLETHASSEIKSPGAPDYYVYVFNNPVNLIDPTGLGAQGVGWTAGNTTVRTSEGPLRGDDGRPIMLADGSGQATADALGRMNSRQQFRERQRPVSLFGSAFPATAAMLGNPPPPGYTEFVHGTVNPFARRMAEIHVASLGALGGFSSGIALIVGAETAGGFALGARVHATHGRQLPGDASTGAGVHGAGNHPRHPQRDGGRDR